jgi:hypothetical protein
LGDKDDDEDGDDDDDNDDGQATSMGVRHAKMATGCVIPGEL